MSIENKAKELVAQLLGENDYDDDSLLSDILHGDPFGEYLKVLSVEDTIVAKPSGGRQYVYMTGYDGGTSHTCDIVIESYKPLREFDDFYGDSSKYPVIAKISAALEAAGFDGLDGFGAGKLERKVATT